MKTLTQLSLAVLFLLVTSSCEKRSCKNVTCASYQTCNAGYCLCPNGYEGDTCNIISATKFIGNWRATENCINDNGSYYNFGPYYTNIYATVPGSAVYGVNIIYFNTLLGGGPVYAQILNTTSTSEGITLYIPPQTLPNGVVITAGSQGYYSPPAIAGVKPTMTITVNYNYQGNSNTCTENFYKQ